jgi:hypothetical protein
MITYTVGSASMDQLGCTSGSWGTCTPGSFDHLTLDAFANTLTLTPYVSQVAQLNLATFQAGVNQDGGTNTYLYSVGRSLAVAGATPANPTISNPFTLVVSTSDTMDFNADGSTVSFTLSNGWTLYVTPLAGSAFTSGGEIQTQVLNGRFEVVPEPAFLGFLAVGLTGLYVARRRRLV